MTWSVEVDVVDGPQGRRGSDRTVTTADGLTAVIVGERVRFTVVPVGSAPMRWARIIRDGEQWTEPLRATVRDPAGGRPARESSTNGDSGHQVSLVFRAPGRRSVTLTGTAVTTPPRRPTMRPERRAGREQGERLPPVHVTTELRVLDETEWVRLADAQLVRRRNPQRTAMALGGREARSRERAERERRAEEARAEEAERRRQAAQQARHRRAGGRVGVVRYRYGRGDVLPSANQIDEMTVDQYASYLADLETAIEATPPLDLRDRTEVVLGVQAPVRWELSGERGGRVGLYPVPYPRHHPQLARDPHRYHEWGRQLADVRARFRHERGMTVHEDELLVVRSGTHARPVVVRAGDLLAQHRVEAALDAVLTTLDVIGVIADVVALGSTAAAHAAISQALRATVRRAAREGLARTGRRGLRRAARLPRERPRGRPAPGGQTAERLGDADGERARTGARTRPGPERERATAPAVTDAEPQGFGTRPRPGPGAPHRPAAAPFPAYGHGDPVRQQLDELVDAIGEEAAAIALRDPEFLALLRSGSRRRLGTEFHTIAARVARERRDTGRLPAGWDLVAERELGPRPSGYSRYDLLLEAPGSDRRLAEIDWKTGYRSAVGARTQMERHARHVREAAGRGPAIQESRHWVDYVSREYRRRAARGEELPSWLEQAVTRLRR